jgi:hypothetical protein
MNYSELIRKPVRVDYENMGGSKVTNYSKYYLITVSTKDVGILRRSKGVTSADYIEIHEIMHILLNHFALNNGVPTVEWNICADLEVNSILNIREPFLHPSKYNLPEDLTAIEYYNLLFNKDKMKEKKDKLEKEKNDLESQKQDKKHNDSNESNDSSKPKKSNEDNRPNETNEFNESNESNKSNKPNESNESNKSNTSNESNELKSKDSSNKEPDSDYDPDKNNQEGRNNESKYDDKINEIKDEIEKIESNEKIGEELKDDSLRGDVIFNCEHIAFEPTRRGVSRSELDKIQDLIYIPKKFNYYKRLYNEITPVIAKNFDFVPTHYKSDYMKLNNRRQSGNLILPGRKKESGGISKKFGKNPTVFIDVSGSTQRIIEELNDIGYHLYKDYG